MSNITVFELEIMHLVHHDATANFADIELLELLTEKSYLVISLLDYLFVKQTNKNPRVGSGA